MVHKKLIFFVIILIPAILGSACSLTGGTPTPTAVEPDAVKTSAAETALALLEERNNQPTETPTPEPPTSTPTLTGSETPEPTATNAGTPVPTGGTDSAAFVADVTIPDGEQFEPGEEFVKTWRLQNNGTSIWSTEYSLVYVSGNQMNGPDILPLTEVVQPGETTDISVPLAAPEDPGIQSGFWMLQNALGVNFGVGPEKNLPVYVEIFVLGGGGQTIPTSPPVSGSGAIDSLGISVDQSAYSGTCPHTFSFSIQVTTLAPTLITIELVAGADTPGYVYNLPAPQSYNLDIGTFTFGYTLSLTDPVNGWALARITSPVIVDSNTTSFSLTCE